MASRLLRASMPQTDKGELDLDDEEVAQTAVELQGEHTATDGQTSPAAEETAAIRINANDYQYICNMVITMLAERERRYRLQEAVKQAKVSEPLADGDITMEEDDDTKQDQEEDSKEYGMTLGGIIQWYLGEIEDRIETEEQYAAELKLIKKILKRMVRKERLLLPVSLVDAETMENLQDNQEMPLRDDIVLVIHPSVNVELLDDL